MQTRTYVAEDAAHRIDSAFSACQMPTQLRPIPLMSVGRRPDNSGRWHEFSAADLEGIAAHFSGAPFVPGHPVDDSPQLGKAAKVGIEDGILWATEYADVDPIFRAIVNSGEMPGVSVKLRLPSHPENKTGFPEIRHIGFLGRSEPADANLPEAQFSAADHEALFTAPPPTQSETMAKSLDTSAAKATPPATDATTPDLADQELAKREAALVEREAQFSRRLSAEPIIEEHVRAGRLLPGEKDGFVALFAALPDSQEIEFSRGDGQVKEPVGQFLKDFLAALPSRIDYGEAAAANQSTSEAAFSQQQPPEDSSAKVRKAMQSRYNAARTA